MQRKTNTTQKFGHALALAAALFWSTLGILGKLTYAFGADPLTVISLRATVATGITGAIVAVSGLGQFRIRYEDFTLFVVYGVIGVGLNYLGYFYALKLTTVATAITLLYTYPSLVVLFGLILFHEPISRGKLCALVLTFFGIVFSAYSQSAPGMGWDPRGLAFGLLAGVANAVYTLVGKRAQTAYTPMTGLFYSFLFGSLALLVFRFAVVGSTFRLNSTVLLLIVTIAIVPTLIGYGAYTYSLGYIEAGKASITSSAEPVFAILLALLFLGEIPSSLQLFGAALIIMGVVALQVKR